MAVQCSAEKECVFRFVSLCPALFGAETLYGADARLFLAGRLQPVYLKREKKRVKEWIWAKPDATLQWRKGMR